MALSLTKPERRNIVVPTLSNPKAEPRPEWPAPSASRSANEATLVVAEARARQTLEASLVEDRSQART